MNTDPNLTAPDDLYANLIKAHDGLTDDESAALSTRLILANQIRDSKVLAEAIAPAKDPASARGPDKSA